LSKKPGTRKLDRRFRCREPEPPSSVRAEDAASPPGGISECRCGTPRPQRLHPSCTRPVRDRFVAAAASSRSC